MSKSNGLQMKKLLKVRNNLGARLLSGTLLLALTIAAIPGHAQTDTPPEESALLRRAIEMAAIYRSKAAHIYNPDGKSTERAASTVAVSAHVLLDAYLATGNPSDLRMATAAGDSLVAHTDMNGDGQVGWGRFWQTISNPSSDERGSNTSFAMGCSLPHNRPYDDEMYDNARIGHFLMDLYNTTGNLKFLQAVRRMVDATWSAGATTQGGSFFYFKTIGPCDRNWHVKNINMLMAVPVGMLAKATGEQKYRDRYAAMIVAELHELRLTIRGRPTPNLGYYGVQTARDFPSRGTYVRRAQTTDLTRTIRCNLRTGAGDSCIRHLGLEARSLDIVRRAILEGPRVEIADIKTLMSDVVATDHRFCQTLSDRNDRYIRDTHCVAYFCALRQIDSSFRKLCETRALGKEPVVTTPDIVLGLFWGRKGRFSRR